MCSVVKFHSELAFGMLWLSHAMICQVDLLSSLAALVGSEVRGRDSEKLTDVLLGKNEQGREELVLEATSRTAYRQGEWVLIPPYPGPALNPLVNIELGNSRDYQLYHLSTDTGQQYNLAGSERMKLEEVIKAFERIRGEEYDKTEELELQ